MGKKLILAVAGSGKTTSILNDLSPERRSLIVTYTNQNLFGLEVKLRERYDGTIPRFVEIRTYFSFLYSFCVRPYFSYHLRDNGLRYGSVPESAQKRKKDTIRHYMSSGRYLYAARAAKLVTQFEALNEVRNRLARHFDNLYVDEVQDFAANDFNLLLDLAQADVEVHFTGDFYQHTYDTSRDGRTRATLHSKGPEAYAAEFVRAGFEIDSSTLARSRRCSPSVCSYITDTIGIDIESCRDNDTEVRFISDRAEALALFQDPETVKLFYQNHSKYDCYSNNWGNSKGFDKYQDVCVVLNKTSYGLLKVGRGAELAPATKNKLYVACSRARGNLYLVEEQLLKSVL